MAKSTFFQSSFVSGELSPLLKGRVDLDQYYQGVQKGEDVLIVPQGGLKRRPGSEVVAEAVNTITRYTTVPTMPNGGTAANINDGNAATNATTGAIGTKGTPAGSPTAFVVAKYDLLSATADVFFVDIVKIKTVTTSATTCQLKIQYSTDDTNWTTAQEFTVSNAETTFRKRLNAENKRYWRLAREGDTGDLGSQTVNLTGFNLWAESATTSDSIKLFNFASAANRQYLGVLTDENMAMYLLEGSGAGDLRTTNYVADIALPFPSSAVMQVRTVQSENVMLLFHEDYAPQRIINNGLSNYDSFVADDIPFLNIPTFDYADAQSPAPVNDVQVLTLTGSWEIGDTFQIDVESVLSKNITYAGDSNPVGNAQNQQSSTEFNLQKNLQEMPVFGDTGVAVSRTGSKTYTITISGESTKAFELFSGFPTSGTASKTLVFGSHVIGSPRKEAVWSATRGYPKIPTFYNGRLWLGGTKSKPQSLLASRAGTFFDFYTEEGDDDEGIFITISARTLTEIIDINPDRGLQVFCSGAEFVVEGDTPTTVEVKAQTQHGASDLEVRSIDGATLFVDQNGRSLRQYVFDFNEDAYTSTDISVLSSHLIDNPVDIEILTGTASSDANWVFIINEDGNGAVLNTVRAQDINGFTKYIPAPNPAQTNSTYLSKLLSACVVENNMYQMVRRKQTGGGWRYLVERWNFDRMLDGSTSTSTAGSTYSITGLDYLEGTELQVVGTYGGVVGVPDTRELLTPRTVSSGTISLTSEEYTDRGIQRFEVGFAFTPAITPMPLNTNAGPGQNQMKQKKICNINLRVNDSAGLYIDGNALPFRTFGVGGGTTPANPFYAGIPTFTGVISDRNGGNGWDIDVVPKITAPDSQPFHIQAIEYEVSSS